MHFLMFAMDFRITAMGNKQAKPMASQYDIVSRNLLETLKIDDIDGVNYTYVDVNAHEFPAESSGDSIYDSLRSIERSDFSEIEQASPSITEVLG